jgi:hypothetical protein
MSKLYRQSKLDKISEAYQHFEIYKEQLPNDVAQSLVDFMEQTMFLLSDLCGDNE